MINFLKFAEERVTNFFEKRMPKIGFLMRRHSRVLRFVVSGGTAATVDLFLLYVFTDWAGIHYLFSAIFAFLFAFGVSFTLQKFWTFENKSMDKVHVQLSVSLAVAVFNLMLNTLLMYLLVEKFGVWYMVAQIITGALLAFESFFIFKVFIFKERYETSNIDTESR